MTHLDETLHALKTAPLEPLWRAQTTPHHPLCYSRDIGSTDYCTCGVRKAAQKLGERARR